MAAVTRVAAGIAFCLLAGGSGAGAVTLEYAVKANFLYKFAPFVNWPPQAFAGGAPLQICIAGADPFGSALDTAVRDQRVNGRAIAVRRMQRVVGAEGCQILFVGTSSAEPPGDMLRAVAGRPVLTVTDEQQRVAGGMIHFVVRNGRVRFTIDRAATTASGLEVSSKLLDLAVEAGG